MYAHSLSTEARRGLSGGTMQEMREVVWILVGVLILWWLSELLARLRQMLSGAGAARAPAPKLRRSDHYPYSQVGTSASIGPQRDRRSLARHTGIAA